VNKKLLIKLPLCIVSVVLAGALVCASMKRGDGGGTSFFHQFVVAGGPIVWFIQVPLSVITVYLIIEQAVTIRRSNLLPASAKAEILGSIRQYGIKQLPARTTFKTDLVSTALRKATQAGAATPAAMEEMAGQSLQEQGMAILRRVEWHNIIGNISPMLGLFGTVIGMIQTFSVMGAGTGQAQPAQLAHGISIAWVTTFWGLLVAIPALAAHGIFRNRVETLVSEAATQVESIIIELRRMGAFSTPPQQIPHSSDAAAV
jgi:biopolymer transport protein ExbB